MLLLQKSISNCKKEIIRVTATFCDSLCFYLRQLMVQVTLVSIIGIKFIYFLIFVGWALPNLILIYYEATFFLVANTKAQPNPITKVEGSGVD